MEDKRDFIPIDKDPIHMIFHSDKWEEVPDEDLWEDGEMSKHRLRYKLYNYIILTGDWKIIRRKNEKQNKPKNSNT